MNDESRLAFLLGHFQPCPGNQTFPDKTKLLDVCFRDNFTDIINVPGEDCLIMMIEHLYEII